MLKYNPFKYRILSCFSTDTSGKNGMSFDDFVSMCTAFSPRAPKQIKIQTAFRIYDYDDDGFITRNDIKWMIRDLNKSSRQEEDWKQGPRFLSEAQIDEVADNVMKEVDYFENGRVTYYEFSKVMNRLQDFKLKFTFSGI